ncbi:MAG: DNA-processing protein DprA [Planctomycetota bacterium]
MPAVQPDRETAVTDDIPYWIALSNVPGVGPVMFRTLCERLGGPPAVFQADDEKLRTIPGLRPETIAAFRDSRHAVRAARELARDLDDQRIAVVTCRDPAYPPCLFDLSDPPPLLYVLGKLPAPDERAFSVSGSTAPSARGADIASAVGRELARADWTVVSGYAYGVDTAAHLGALEENGRTVLVLPMGIRAFELRAEFLPFGKRIGGDVVLASECPPDEAWSSRAAVMRDRIIAALGRGLLAVEARPQGGTMITFRHALKLGRPAYVVKYRRSPPGASGNRLAIRAGGLPVASLSAFREIITARELPRAAPKAKQGELF